jgi:hypothetical protein
VLGEELVEVLEELWQAPLIVDGYGVTGASSCPGGADKLDCNDGDASVRPEGQEVLLGHASVATTQIYTHASIGHLKETLQRCHPRERTAAEEPKEP